jgi:hypothetical protein
LIAGGDRVVHDFSMLLAQHFTIISVITALLCVLAFAADASSP